MGYTRDSPEWQKMIDTMVNNWTLEECKKMKQFYLEKGVSLGVKQVEEAMRKRLHRRIDQWDHIEGKSRHETRQGNSVNGKYVEYVPLQSDFGAMHACLARM